MNEYINIQQHIQSFTRKHFYFLLKKITFIFFLGFILSFPKVLTFIFFLGFTLSFPNKNFQCQCLKLLSSHPQLISMGASAQLKSPSISGTHTHIHTQTHPYSYLKVVLLQTLAIAKCYSIVSDNIAWHKGSEILLHLL